MCEKCRTENMRAAIALASAMYVLMEQRKTGDALSGLCSAIKDGYRFAAYDGEDKERRNTENDARLRPILLEKLARLDGAELSEALCMMESVDTIVGVILKTLQFTLVERYKAGDRSMSELDLGNCARYVEREEAMEVLSEEERERVRSGEAQFVPISKELAEALIASGAAVDERPPEERTPVLLGKMSPHVQ